MKFEFCSKMATSAFEATHRYLIKFCKDLEANPREILKLIKLTKSLRNALCDQIVKLHRRK